MGHTYSTVKEGIRFSWDVEDLWEASKTLVTSEWEIPSEFLKCWMWGQTHPSQHIERCLSSDLSYPILVHEGKIIDGCHRVIKALAQGKTVITAKVLVELPLPYEKGGPLEEESSKGVIWSNLDMVEIVKAFLDYEKKIEYGFRHPIDGI